MKRSTSTALAFVSVCWLGSSSIGTAAPSPSNADAPIYELVLTARTTSAVNYRDRDSTKIDFRGTALLPTARGEAIVKSNRGRTAIEAEFEKLEPATKFGPEYLTYVLWAVTPAGRATSLGELALDRSRGELEAATDLQTFAMIVTAEPYFGVTQPSDVVVMENIVRPNTAGKIEQVDAKYELLARGQYTLDVGSDAFERRVFDPRVPQALYQAQNAVLLTRLAGADQYASENYQKATRLLQQAENAQAKKSSQKSVAVLARQAIQAAEDARLITVKRRQEEQLAQERQAAAASEQRAKADAEAAARREEAETTQRARAEHLAQLERERQQIERDRLDAERAKIEAETAVQRAARERADAEAARSAAEAERRRATEERQAAADRDTRTRLETETEARRVAEAETDRLREAERLRQESELHSQRAAREKADAEARQTTETERAAQVQAERQREEQGRREVERLREEAELTSQRATREKADTEARQAAETQRAAQLQAERQQLDEARAQAERAKQEAETAAQRAAQVTVEAEAARVRLAEERRAAAELELRAKAAAEQQRSEAARLEAERAKLQAETAAEQALREKAEALVETEQARQAALEAQRRQQDAEREHAKVEADLQQRLNAILETRETERGLVINMADVVFGTGQHALLAGAREKLARIAGLLLSQPELRLAIGGHTDALGSDVANQTLSERRANSVREFLIQQGLPAESITAEGFGESQPVTTNDTPEGRQQNRRVEIVVSGAGVGKDG